MNKKLVPQRHRDTEKAINSHRPLLITSDSHFFSHAFQLCASVSLWLVIFSSTALLTGCGEDAKQPETQGNGLRQYDKNLLARGERVFMTNCAVCHGNGGEGKPGWQQPGPDGKLLPPPLDGSGRVWRLSSSQMQQFVHQGSPDGRASMPAWQGKLSEQEISDVVIWITSLWSDAVYMEWKTKAERTAQ